MIQKIKLYFPDMVFGAIDGIVTTFAIIAGVYGASLSASLILILGFSNLFADGFSMGVSNYVATGSQVIEVQTSKKPFTCGLVTFFSFIVVGFVPLIPFLFYIIQGKSVTIFVYMISFSASLISFFILGVLKGLVTKSSLIKSGSITFLIGATASCIAFLVGHLLSGLV